MVLRRVRRVTPPTARKAHQRAIRERHERENPREQIPNLTGCWVERITRAEAEALILEHEWLASMGPSPQACYGLRSPGGELLGAVVFGYQGGTHSRDICGPNFRELAICLQRGACVHWAPPNAASFLISRAVKLAAREHGWRVFYAYADPEAGEVGQVYQACNWLYLGAEAGRYPKPGIHELRQDWITTEGKTVSSRTLSGFGLTIAQARRKGWRPVWRHPKGKYVTFVGGRSQCRALRAALRYPPQPYPKRMKPEPLSWCACCGGPIAQPTEGRPRKFCSNPCRQWSYRQRSSPVEIPAVSSLDVR